MSVLSSALVGAWALSVTAAPAPSVPTPSSLRADIDPSSIDPDVKPGQDFFLHANGLWLKQVRIPADKSAWGVGAELSLLTQERNRVLIEAAAAGQVGPSEGARQVGAYFRSFMDEDAIEAAGFTPLQPRLARIAKITDPRELARALGETLRADVDPMNNTSFHTENVLGLWIAQGLQDPSHHHAYLLQGGLGMPSRDYYLDAAPAMKQAREAYLAHVLKVITLAQLDQGPLASSQSLTSRAQAIVALETLLARHHASQEESSDIQKSKTAWTLAQLRRQAPGLDWDAYLQAAGLGSLERFHIWHPRAMKGLAQAVRAVPLSTWRDYLAFHAVNQRADSLPRAMRQQHFEFYGKVLAGAQEPTPRWQVALGATNAALQDEIAKLYVAQYFPARSKAKAEQLVKDVVDAFDRRLDGLAWMSPKTRAEARSKLRAMIVGVGYPDRWDDALPLAVSDRDAFGNAERAGQLIYQRELGRLKQRVDRSRWCMEPHLVNAVNMPMQNALNFPAAILHSPYFDPDAPDAVNYGAIGAVIGHEISHSFDDQGAQFDAKGRLRNWWTQADLKHFQKAGKALVAQYSAYKPLPDLAINGQQTLSENLADLAGLQSALDAYHQALKAKGDTTPTAEADRRFFLAYAQSWREVRREQALRRQVLTDGHAPEHQRVLTVRNLDAWYSAFDVQPGDAMYLKPSERVRAW